VLQLVHEKLAEMMRTLYLFELLQVPITRKITCKILIHHRGESYRYMDYSLFRAYRDLEVLPHYLPCFAGDPISKLIHIAMQVLCRVLHNIIAITR
jgi:hypothetical protein